MKTGLKDPAYIPGPRYKSDGFRIEEMVRVSSMQDVLSSCIDDCIGFDIQGPKSLENCMSLSHDWISIKSKVFSFLIVGHAEVMKMAEDIQGCPVKGPWARKTS